VTKTYLERKHEVQLAMQYASFSKRLEKMEGRLEVMTELCDDWKDLFFYVARGHLNEEFIDECFPKHMALGKWSDDDLVDTIEFHMKEDEKWSAK
jgi:hypothetical protein